MATILSPEEPQHPSGSHPQMRQMTQMTPKTHLSHMFSPQGELDQRPESQTPIWSFIHLPTHYPAGEPHLRPRWIPQ